MKINTLHTLSAFLLLAGTSHAATILSITATGSNDANNGSNFGAGGIAALTNDSFTYNPDDPTSTSPNRGSNNSVGINNLFHANHTNGQDVTIDFTLVHTVLAGETTIVIDLWGRDAIAADIDRDDDIVIELFDGTTSLGVSSNVGIASPDPQHSRATFNLAAGTNITRFVLTGGDTEGQAAANYFTLAEVEAAAIPEPSSTALLGLGGLALILRRRK